MSRYKLTYKFFDTEQEAQAFCDEENKSKYIKKRHPAGYTLWESHDRTECKFVAWYYYK